MRRLFISTFVSLAWVVPALAQDSLQNQTAVPNTATAAPNTAQDQNDTLSQGAQSIERSVQAHLALAGFTEIQMVPTSFLVRAKDPNGKTVMLVLSPDSIAELQEGLSGHGGGQDGSPSSEAPSGQAPATSPGA